MAAKITYESIISTIEKSKKKKLQCIYVYANEVNKSDIIRLEQEGFIIRGTTNLELHEIIQIKW